MDAGGDHQLKFGGTLLERRVVWYIGFWEDSQCTGDSVWVERVFILVTFGI